MTDSLDREALEYHTLDGRPGKLEIRATKPMATQLDLSLAYSPGVAAPCREIARDPEKVFDYTARGNLVAVVTNGTAVLGLGNIGPAASKPVMEGKAVLFKRFADIDVFDLEIDGDAETVIAVVKALEPTFGGVNLEDIKAPECFYIEERLRAETKIPIFHDDQHGTAIIAGAGMLNALEIAGKTIGDVRVVVSGAGASAIACTTLFCELGVDPAKVLMCDSRGVISTRRQIDNPYKQVWVRETEAVTLADALKGADVFLGLSVAGLVSPEMIATMAPNPIVFALANPDPEIPYPDVMAVRPDAIMATGRSDYPNQVNNVLGFPYIFRGALDVRATGIDQHMKMAAVRALAALAREAVPSSVSRAYGGETFHFGREYIIPKPFDPRVLLWVAPAVAKAAGESGLARQPITDWDAYRARLERMMDPGRGMVRDIIDHARRSPTLKRIVFAEGDEARVLRAARVVAREGIGRPLLMGIEGEIRALAERIEVPLDGIEIVQPAHHPKFESYVERYVAEGQRKGVTAPAARHDFASRTVYGLMMVREGDADGIVVGVGRPYARSMRAALRIIGPDGTACGLYIVIVGGRTLFFADTTVHIEPDAETLAAITRSVVRVVRGFDIEPRVAMLSFANFGSVNHHTGSRMAAATAILHRTDPDLMVDGEMQVDVAVDMDLRGQLFPWSRVTEPANVFVFPNLAAANIAYKMLDKLGGASIVGPLLLGMKRPVSIAALNADVSDLVNLAAWTAFDAARS